MSEPLWHSMELLNLFFRCDFVFFLVFAFYLWGVVFGSSLVSEANNFVAFFAVCLQAFWEESFVFADFSPAGHEEVTVNAPILFPVIVEGAVNSDCWELEVDFWVCGTHRVILLSFHFGV